MSTTSNICCKVDEILHSWELSFGSKGKKAPTQSQGDHQKCLRLTSPFWRLTSSCQVLRRKVTSFVESGVTVWPSRHSDMSIFPSCLRSMCSKKICKFSCKKKACLFWVLHSCSLEERTTEEIFRRPLERNNICLRFFHPVSSLLGRRKYAIVQPLSYGLFPGNAWKKYQIFILDALCCAFFLSQVLRGFVRGPCYSNLHVGVP